MNRKYSILSLLDDDLGKALQIILDQTDQHTYKWQSTKENRQAMARQMDKSPATVSRYIDRLKAKDILITFEEYQRGTYMINRQLINFA